MVISLIFILWAIMQHTVAKHFMGHPNCLQMCLHKWLGLMEQQQKNQSESDFNLLTN